MLTNTELSSLERSLRGTKTLSVYVDGAADDPAERTAWRRALSDAIGDARSALRDAAHVEREAFERAAARLEERLDESRQVSRSPGWVAFVTADDVRHAGPLPVSVPPTVAWGDGIRIAPYVQALERHRTAAVAVVDSRTAHVYEYRDGRIERRGTLHARAHVGPVTHMGNPPGPGFHVGTRGETGTDEAERARRVGRERLLGDLAERMTGIAGPDGWLLVGGIPEVASAAVERLPDQARGRARVIQGLDVHATEAQVAAHASGTTAALGNDAAVAAVSEILDRHAAGGAGSAGPQGTLDALRARAVDRLYFTDHFLRDQPLAAEEAVRAAFDQDAEVTWVDGPAAERLDAEAGGVAARLRFLPTRGQPPLAAARP